MLNKSDIKRILADLNYPKAEYAVASGSALVLHGVKELTRDVDLGCTSELFIKLLDKNTAVKTLNDGTRVIELNEYVEILEGWMPDEVVDIDGIPAASIESVRRSKVKLGREKDFKDIELIDQFLNRGKS